MSYFEYSISIPDAYTTEDVYYTWYESEGNLAKTNGVEWVAADGPDFVLTKVESTQEQLRTSSKGLYAMCTFSI